MIITQATEAHAQAIFDLDDYVLRDPKDMNILKEWIHNQHVSLLLSDETVIGYTAVGMSSHAGEEHRGYIFSIAVHRDHRRHGYGTCLLAHAIETLQKLGAGVVDLDVRRSNAPAIALYEEFGFKRYSVRPNIYDDGEDALIYLKTL